MGAGVRITSKLDQFEDATKRRAETAMTKMLITGAAHAATMTPVATSNLVNSQYKNVSMDAARVYGRVGYTAEYAGFVHSAEGKLKGKPRPKKIGGVYWGPGGRPAFLREGFEEAKPLLRSILKKEMKR